MRYRNIKIQRWKYVVTDWMTTSIAFLLFDVYRYFFLGLNTVDNVTLPIYLTYPALIVEQIFVPIILLGVYWLSGYYNRPYEKSRLAELITTLYSATLNTVMIYLVMMINYHLWDKMASYQLLGVLFLLLFFCTYLGRISITQSTINRFKRHRMEIRTVIIGNSPKARSQAELLSRGTQIVSHRILGFVPIDDEKADPAPLPDGCRHITHLDTLVEMAAHNEVDEFVIIPEHNDEKTVMRILYALFPLEKSIKIAPDMLSMMTNSVRMHDLRSIPLMDISSAQISDCTRNLKRTLDVLISLTALVILSPVLAAVAIGVKRSSPGPVIYSQERVGYHQKPFRIFKFRSMYIDAEAQGPALSDDSDPRVTPFGRILRKYRLDEFPQFWNVLRGDMSLVGPRPEREYYIRKIVKEVPYYTMVHQVRPGITSLGMVKFGYARNIDEMVTRSRYDLIYLANMSLSMDLKIVIYTVNTVIGGKGV